MARCRCKLLLALPLAALSLYLALLAPWTTDHSPDDKSGAGRDLKYPELEAEIAAEALRGRRGGRSDVAQQKYGDNRAGQRGNKVVRGLDPVGLDIRGDDSLNENDEAEINVKSNNLIGRGSRGGARGGGVSASGEWREAAAAERYRELLQSLKGATTGRAFPSLTSHDPHSVLDTAAPPGGATPLPHTGVTVQTLRRFSAKRRRSKTRRRPNSESTMPDLGDQLGNSAGERGESGRSGVSGKGIGSEQLFGEGVLPPLQPGLPHLQPLPTESSRLKGGQLWPTEPPPTVKPLQSLVTEPRVMEAAGGGSGTMYPMGADEFERAGDSLGGELGAPQQYDLPILLPAPPSPTPPHSDATANSETKRKFEPGDTGHASPPERQGASRDDSHVEGVGDVKEGPLAGGVGEPVEGGIEVVGRLNVSRQYAVYSTTTQNREALTFQFLIPLTALAWRRVGFDSVVVVVGERGEWEQDPLLTHVLRSAQQHGAIFVFMQPRRTEHATLLSQVSRLFAANILRAAFPRLPGLSDVYMLTSDADIWPLSSDAYRLPPHARVLALNSDCCSGFTHRGRNYRMLPMTNVGMTIGTWHQLTERYGVSPVSVDDTLTVLLREFGPVALRPSVKGDNVGWYLDQMLLSILVSHWAEGGQGVDPQSRGDVVAYVPRDVGVDRIDRSQWEVGWGEDGGGRVDAHLLLEGWVPGVWVRLLALVRVLYARGSPEYHWCVEYYELFQALFIDRRRGETKGH